VETVTVIAAAYDSPTSYALGADSHGEQGGVRVPAVKTARLPGGWLCGHTGDAVDKQAVVPVLAGAEPTEFASFPALDALLRRAYSHALGAVPRPPSSYGMDSSFLLVGPLGVVLLSGDGGVMVQPRRWAIGCGTAVALGAMAVLAGPPDAVVRSAVQVACSLVAGCYGEVVVLAAEDVVRPGRCVAPVMPARVLDMTIEEMDLSVRTTNLLAPRNWSTSRTDAAPARVRDLVLYRESDLLRMRNFGRRCVNEIKEFLADCGLRLGMTAGEIATYEARP